MIVILRENPEKKQFDNLVAWIEAQGVIPHVTQGVHQTILGLVGDTAKIDIDLLQQMEIVEAVKRVQEPFKNANRKFHPLDTVIKVKDAVIGGGNMTVIAGPCSVES